MSVKSSIDALPNAAVATLTALYDQQCQKRTFTGDLLRLLTQETYQHSASWLLKHHLEQGWVLNRPQTLKLYEGLIAAEPWETLLHLMQCLPYVTVRTEDANRLVPSFRTALAHNNKFVRAWAYNALHQVALADPSYQEEVTWRLEAAMDSEAPSVKARVRHILKVGFTPK